jgi:hypothetical protein
LTDNANQLRADQRTLGDAEIDADRTHGFATRAQLREQAQLQVVAVHPSPDGPPTDNSARSRRPDFDSDSHPVDLQGSCIV